MNAFQATLLDEVCCAALGVGHPGEDLGNQKTDVVIDPDVRAHHPGAGQPPVVTGQREGQESGIQVDDRRKGVEGPLGHGSLGTSSRRGRRLAGHGADELHEQFWEFHVVQGGVGAQRWDTGLGGVVPAARGHHIDR